MYEVNSQPKKRLFLSLVLVGFFLICLSIYGIWAVTLPGLSNINEFLPLFSGIIFSLVCIVLASGIICIFLAFAGICVSGIFQQLAWLAVSILFPVTIIIGKIFKIDKEKIEGSFIAVSNHLVRKRGIIISPEKLLILTPHCIQKETCPHKVTKDVNNCRRCGQCQVGELLKISETSGAKLAVVTGGTLARKVIKDLRPEAVLAIACERDLTSGIQEVFPMPVIGILNKRPNGPCCDTEVDIDDVKKTIANFCGGK
jgi:hypothetical protein